MVYLNIGSVVVRVMHGVEPILHGIGRSVCFEAVCLAGTQISQDVHETGRLPAGQVCIVSFRLQAYINAGYKLCIGIGQLGLYNSVTRGCMHACFCTSVDDNSAFCTVNETTD